MRETKFKHSTVEKNNKVKHEISKNTHFLNIYLYFYVNMQSMGLIMTPLYTCVNIFCSHASLTPVVLSHAFCLPLALSISPHKRILLFLIICILLFSLSIIFSLMMSFIDTWPPYKYMNNHIHIICLSESGLFYLKWILVTIIFLQM